MTETTERTAMLDALRLDLARALGLTRQIKDGCWRATCNAGRAHYGTTAQKAIWGAEADGGGFPDWPRVDTEAWLVCVEIAKRQRYNIERFTRIEDGKDFAHFVPYGSPGDPLAKRKWATGATPAEALTRLALAAKRGEGA